MMLMGSLWPSPDGKSLQKIIIDGPPVTTNRGLTPLFVAVRVGAGRRVVRSLQDASPKRSTLH